MPRQLTARCKFHGQFPTGNTRATFTADLPKGMAEQVSKTLASAFREVAAEEWPDATTRPALRKLVITITLP